MRPEWSDEELDGAERAAEAVIGEPIPEDIRMMARKMFAAIMTRAVELVAARGGTLGSKVIGSIQRRASSVLSAPECRPGPFAFMTRDLLAHVASQGATVAMLQAKVSELEGRLATEEAERIRCRDGWATASAEVERLKAELVQKERIRQSDQSVMLEYADRWKSAESRLAAIREKTTAQLEATRRAIATEKAKPRPSQARVAEFQMAEVALEPIAKALEGDAPQEAKGGLGCICAYYRGACKATRHPCSPTCTHDDARTPGHPERVKERSDAWEAMHPNGSCTCAGEGTCAWCDRESKETYYDRGAEDMRAACWEAVLRVAQTLALGPTEQEMLKAAIEGATP